MILADGRLSTAFLRPGGLLGTKGFCSGIRLSSFPALFEADILWVSPTRTVTATTKDCCRHIRTLQCPYKGTVIFGGSTQDMCV